MYRPSSSGRPRRQPARGPASAPGMVAGSRRGSGPRPFRGLNRRGVRLLGTITLLLGTTAGIVTVATSGASTREPVTVTVTASPASGSTVHPGTMITYRLHATSRQPLPAGTTVVDDLSGLLGHASIATTRAGLARHGLTLKRTTEKLTWTLPALGTARTGSAATASFRATVAADPPRGATLSTAAFPPGGTCSAGGPCATTLTVKRARGGHRTAPTRPTRLSLQHRGEHPAALARPTPRPSTARSRRVPTPPWSAGSRSTATCA